ncbi:translation initiation factor IF-2-like [Serinus canaria]|uniref:translation initiation factor IF-2-like n=1 Tax=Serinus canaria TaxID=9135 RepID=UPI0021CC83F8|nr:translation initiation factor IF-2-like [Serinus canaria]
MQGRPKAGGVGRCWHLQGGTRRAGPDPFGTKGRRLRPSGLYCAAPRTPRLRDNREGERGQRDKREAKGQQERSPQSPIPVSLSVSRCHPPYPGAAGGEREPPAPRSRPALSGPGSPNGRGGSAQAPQKGWKGPAGAAPAPCARARRARSGVPEHRPGPAQARERTPRLPHRLLSRHLPALPGTALGPPAPETAAGAGPEPPEGGPTGPATPRSRLGTHRPSAPGRGPTSVPALGRASAGARAPLRSPTRERLSAALSPEAAPVRPGPSPDGAGPGLRAPSTRTQDLGSVPGPRNAGLGLCAQGLGEPRSALPKHRAQVPVSQP